MGCRKIISGVLCAAAIAFAPPAATAEPVQKIKFMEVIHSLFYSPLYVAHGLGYFKQEGIDFDLVAAQGSDKATAALLSGAADVVLVGPETAVYIQNGQSPEKIRIFAGLTATDGSFLVGREKQSGFSWASLKGKTILGWRKGSAPAIFLDKVLKDHGLDPEKDVTIVTNVAIPARLGAFMAGTADYGTFFEPDVTKIEASGKGYSLANVGVAAGKIDYTVFTARESYIKANPKVIQGFTDAIARAERWLQTADPQEAAKTLAPYFPGVSAAELAASVSRHREAGVWKASPLVSAEAIGALQDLLVASGVLGAGEKVAYEKVVDPAFAKAAK
ncbi:ABC transporter substrate-binding protein [Rhodoplanes sp. TEM]|uniref:ABC transporter substrate-binding protein n=1 Tax=Rhodoplanes tepidamans TaxID=200616 RepID=A0ABT5J967_RHOTP|nr:MULTISPECIES: ABC transporter substrate-binding protein [Rhodoplanes]MDC7786033.1 ABC transporter substrate-binding protein [Rhodoplanes tepidamans]MDC7983826.1 ABC transporter substrate-binding protein [Rhodoplanes sp. TEM]MDQ0354875.1 NitT/TauT family transport system substrate-binding protein [Rhodoplanes tepidamans]